MSDRAAAESSIRRRLIRISAQRRALQLAVTRYADDEGRFDLGRWTEAFESAEPETINHVVEVTGGYQMVVNHLVEALRTGAGLAGLEVGRPPSGPGLIAAVRDDGGLTRAQAEALTELYRNRNRLQHASPDIQADEVHEQVELLLRTLPRLVGSFVAWLSRHDVELVPERDT
ncbi:MAG: hypothetical protein ACRDL0_05890 [Thermoleophilaceae bacterium]